MEMEEPWAPQRPLHERPHIPPLRREYTLRVPSADAPFEHVCTPPRCSRGPVVPGAPRKRRLNNDNDGDGGDDGDGGGAKAVAEAGADIIAYISGAAGDITSDGADAITDAGAAFDANRVDRDGLFHCSCTRVFTGLPQPNEISADDANSDSGANDAISDVGADDANSDAITADSAYAGE